MPFRTDASRVQSVLMGDYNSKKSPSLTEQIRTANILTTRVINKGQQDGILIDDDLASMLETWIAAHMYCVSDRPRESNSVLGVSNRTPLKIDLGLKSTHYGQTAIELDPTGVLDGLMEHEIVASITWLGKTEKEETPYWLR